MGSQDQQNCGAGGLEDVQAKGWGLRSTRAIGQDPRATRIRRQGPRATRAIGQGAWGQQGSGMRCQGPQLWSEVPVGAEVVEQGCRAGGAEAVGQQQQWGRAGAGRGGGRAGRKVAGKRLRRSGGEPGSCRWDGADIQGCPRRPTARGAPNPARFLPAGARRVPAPSRRTGDSCSPRLYLPAPAPAPA